MNQEDFGKFIKDIRKKYGLTQKELADKYGVTYQAVSKWENGKNIPDIALIKRMGKDFNVSLEDMLEGKYRPTKKFFWLISILVSVIILIIILLVVLFNINSNKDFQFKTISSGCSNFTISGSISYNNSKSAIYISNINYCGGEDLEAYKKIDCTLYENLYNTKTKISSTIYDKNISITLEQFLKDLTFTVDNYTQVCKEYSKNSLYLEINATNEEGRVTSYEIPISLNSDCSK